MPLHQQLVHRPYFKHTNYTSTSEKGWVDSSTQCLCLSVNAVVDPVFHHIVRYLLVMAVIVVLFINDVCDYEVFAFHSAWAMVFDADSLDYVVNVFVSEDITWRNDGSWNWRPATSGSSDLLWCIAGLNASVKNRLECVDTRVGLNNLTKSWLHLGWSCQQDLKADPAKRQREREDILGAIISRK